MRYEGLIDTVSDIVITYGVGILSDSKFWNILTDTYPFVGEHSLKDSFKDFLSNGNIKELIKLKGRRKEALIRIDKVLTQIKKIAPSKTPEISAILFSVSIAIGSCKKLDYEDYLNGGGNPRPKQGKKPNNKQITYYSAVYLRTILGVITLVGGTLLYGWFLLGEASMFWIVCLIGLMQLGTLKIVDEYLHCKVPDDKKIRILSYFIPIILGYIIVLMILLRTYINIFQPILSQIHIISSLKIDLGMRLEYRQKWDFWRFSICYFMHIID